MTRPGQRQRSNDEALIAAAERAEETRQRILRMAFRDVMGTPSGRRVLWSVIDGRCGTFGASYTGNSETFFREGRRAVGIELMADLQSLVPDLFIKMLSEDATEKAAAARLVLSQAAEKGQRDGA